MEHGLDAETRLEAPRIDDAETTDAPGLPPLGQRLFDALLPLLPASTEALDDLLQAGASPAGAGLLAQLLTRVDSATALLLNLLESGADRKNGVVGKRV